MVKIANKPKHYSYGKIGYCIYCGSRTYDINKPDRPLASEHIVPLGLGGSLCLPESSCAECEAITSAFEGFMLRRVFGPLRIHFETPTRRPKERPSTLPILATYGDNTKLKLEVPVDDHPLVCALPLLDPPRILAKPTGGEKKVHAVFPGGLEIRDYKMTKINAQIGANRIETSTYVEYENLRLLLAKIAHALSMAVFRPERFYPFLGDIIRRRDAESLKLYVGSTTETEPADLPAIHYTNPRKVYRGRQCLLVWDISLFKMLGLPMYSVVAGRFYEGASQNAMPCFPLRSEPIKLDWHS